MILTCTSCGNEFVFEKEEKELYERLGFDHAPKRCPSCRGSSKAIIGAIKPEKIMYAAICSECGKETQLPFKPKGDKPVYCKACFSAKKNG